MNQLKAQQIQLAKEKINRSQRRQTVIKSKPGAKSGNNENKLKPRANKSIKKSRTNNPSRIDKTFFPEIPVGHFGYSRPREARLATKREREVANKFIEEFNYRQQTRKFSFEDFLREANTSQSEKEKGRLKK